MSQHAPAGGQPSTFNTNVNRAKTKKWVEAKSYSYDGDDWGDADDYDEYGGYDEPEPEQVPVAKPTGFRQRGQSASQVPQDPYSARQDPYQSPVDTRIYGNVGGPPGRQQQQQYGSRSATNPQPQAPAMRRMNSFDPEEERRAFSASGPPQSKGNGVGTQMPSQHIQDQNVVAHDFQSGQKYPNQRPEGQPIPARPSANMPSRPSTDQSARYGGHSQPQAGNYQSMYPDQPRQSNTGSRTQSMASTNSGLDFHNRRDFSPSAMPPPLQTRGSPSPHSRSSSGHPPRKSSLSLETAPSLPLGAQSPANGIGEADDNMPPASERAAIGAGKALPFVRPADIYRRMQEEKEKQRQSQESARPSMDALMSKSNDNSGLGSPQDNETSQRTKVTLPPVTERGGEYDLGGVNINEQSKPEERRSTTSKKFELPKRKSNSGSPGVASSLQPVLPDVSRVSGFGESFFSPSSSSHESLQEPFRNFAGPTASAPAQVKPKEATPEKDLRNQPSLGFTSAVHEAFDRAEDQVPPTPTSTADSTVGRSTSGGTSAVSPIISRGPSTSAENGNSRLPGIDDVTTPTNVDAPEGSSSRPISSNSLGTPKQIARKPSPSPVVIPQSTDLPSPSFVPGHRRDLSTPSPDNSPARTPALEVNRQLRQPQEVELTAATPTDPSFSTNNSSNVSEIAEQESNAIHPTETASRGRSDIHVDTRAMAKNFSGRADQAGSPTPYPQNYLRTRTDSGSSSRVRDLADRFESGSRPGSAHSATPRSSVFGNTSLKKDDLIPTRPLADRMESFRPHLPGGWESSASIAPVAALKGPEPTTSRTQPDSIATTGGLSEDIASSEDQAPSSMTQIKDASEEAFTAVAAAGTALAGAFAAAVGMDQHNGPDASIAETPSDEHPAERRSEDYGAKTHKGNAPANTIVNPEATKPYLPDTMDDEASTAAPTPLSKDIVLDRTEYSKTSDYFPPPKNEEHPGWTGRNEGTAPATRPPMLPMLSTDTEGPQYESDRLRREIVRELSPLNVSEPTTAQTDYSNYQDASISSTNQSLPRPGHESGGLPREYESYWNDANSDDDTSHFSSEPGRLEDATTASRQQGATIIGEPLRPRHVEKDTFIREPLHLSRQEQDVQSGPTGMDEGSRESPRVLQHRFSWEQPLLSPQPLPAESHTTPEAPDPLASDLPRPADSDTVRRAPEAPVSDFLRSAVYPEGRTFQPQDHPEDSELSTLPNLEDPLHKDGPGLTDQDASIPKSQNNIGQHDEMAGIEKELPDYNPGLELAPSSMEKDRAEHLEAGYDDGTNPISQESQMLQSERRHDLESPLLEPPLPEPSIHEPPQTLGGQDGELPPLPPSDVQSKMLAFRDILALRSASERIRAYNDTREQFADLNTGLAHWLAIKANDLPEHADLFANPARRPAFQGHKPSPSRSKLGGLLQSGGHSSQLYPNSPQSASEGAATGGGLGKASSHGYSASGASNGKISSQQVQAKGKDLLHTAGVFGGKANVAAKGLFSKGKSKLRGSSGVEKASPTPLQSYSPEPRGMQQRPKSIEAQPTAQSASTATTQSNVPTPQNVRADYDIAAAPIPTVPHQQESPAIASMINPEAANEIRYEHVSPNQAGIRTQSQKSQPMPQTSGQDSPRDTPSFESFSQSQEGDDERSEESAPTSHDHPPRASSLYLKGLTSQKSSRSTPATIENNAPTLLEETQLANSYVGSPKQVQTPRSATSSNKTPTQATFTDVGHPAIPAVFPVTTNQTSIQHHRGAGSSPRSFFEPQSGFSAQNLANNHQSQEPKIDPRLSQGSEGTFHTAGSGDDRPETLSSTFQNTQNQETSLDTYSQVPTDLHMPQQSEALQTKSLDSPTDVQNDRSDTVAYNSLNPQEPSQDHVRRGPNIDSDLRRTNFDQPPSPLTPRQPTNNGASEQRGRIGPIHYGIDHDFDRPSEADRSRSRSPSYSLESYRKRRSQDSRPSLDPNILEHPAFRTVAEGNGMPAQFYPRQQTAEEMLVGGPPTVGKRSESKSRSRRGSRGSAFFKAFTSPSKSDHPPLPHASDSQASSSPRYSPAIGDRRSKGLSLFRSRSGNIASGSGESPGKDNMAPPDASPRGYLTQAPRQADSMTPRRAEEDVSSKGVSSKLTKKLQRASTSVKPEPDSGKKKRFSALGTLFGGRKRQTSTIQSRVSPQQAFEHSPPIQTQQRDTYNVVQPQRQEQHGYDPPREERVQPPREGYYAPGRQDRGSSQPTSPYSSPNTGPRQSAQSYSRAPDTPAYVQDSALRVRQLMSPVEQPPNAALPRTSATFPHRSPQHSSSSVARSSTSHQARTGEAFTQRPERQSKASGSSWTRFSSHSRSKSRPEQARPPSNGALSSPPPQSSALAAPSNTPATRRRSFQEPVRSESPPPPPPPPKDNWHRARPRDSSGLSPSLINQQSRHSPSPSQSSPDPTSTRQRQSLPPLQTNVRNTKSRNSAIGPGRTLTPEEKRKSRQLEIERSSIPPPSPARNIAPRHVQEEEEVVEAEDEEPVMSATSFPGQLWQPSYAHWDE